MKRKEMLFIIGALLICSIFLLTGYIVHNKKGSGTKPNISLNKNNKFDYKFIKEIEGNDNTLVSPLSMAYLLSMIQSGAKGNTLNELNIALDNYDLQPMENIDSNISMANRFYFKCRYPPSYRRQNNRGTVTTVRPPTSSHLRYTWSSIGSCKARFSPSRLYSSCCTR